MGWQPKKHMQLGSPCAGARSGVGARGPRRESHDATVRRVLCIWTQACACHSLVVAAAAAIKSFNPGWRRQTKRQQVVCCLVCSPGAKASSADPGSWADGQEHFGSGVGTNVHHAEWRNLPGRLAGWSAQACASRHHTMEPPQPCCSQVGAFVATAVTSQQAAFFHAPFPAERNGDHVSSHHYGYRGGTPYAWAV